MKKAWKYIILFLVLGAAIGISVALWPKAPGGSPRDNIVQSRILNAPTLDSINPTSDTGIIVLTWQAEPALLTKVYRANAEFSAASYATVIATLGDASVQVYTYTDIVTEEGTFSYAIAVTNAVGESGISNLITVVVSLPLTIIQPVEVSVTPVTSIDGKITISWTASPGAVKYELYRSSLFYTTINNAMKIATVNTGSSLTFVDELTVNGQFYYGVVAIGAEGQSSILSGLVYAVVNKPAIDWLVYWAGLFTGCTLQQSDVPFVLGSFASPKLVTSMTYGSDYLNVYELNDVKVTAVMPITYNPSPTSASQLYNIRTISATGKCALYSPQGGQWYLVVKP